MKILSLIHEPHLPNTAGNRKSWLIVIAGLATFALVMYFDYITSENLNFSIFYLIPIAVFCWYFGPLSAGLVAVAGGLTWPFFVIIAGKQPSFYTYWNGVVSFAFYAIFIGSVTAIKMYIRREHATNEQLSKALSEVKQLSGLLPICSSCKKIRDDKGQWHVMEGYIQKRTDARFSHGLCPECARRLYPDFAKETGI